MWSKQKSTSWKIPALVLIKGVKSFEYKMASFKRERKDSQKQKGFTGVRLPYEKVLGNKYKLTYNFCILIAASALPENKKLSIKKEFC